MQRNKRTPHTVIDLSELTHIIDRVTKVGYAIEKDETDIGVTCIAAAIVQYDAVVGAVSLSVPSARLDRSKESALINAIKNTTLTISKLLSKRGVAHERIDIRIYHFSDDAPIVILCGRL